MSLVRLQSEPPFAGLAHLVERHLAKVEVASSSLVTRSLSLIHILRYAVRDGEKVRVGSVLAYRYGDALSADLAERRPFILEYGNAYPLRRESNSPDFTRKGNPQRFPFHTFPSLRGGGAFADVYKRQA